MGFMMIVIPKGYESAAPDAVPGAEAVAKTRPVHLGAVQSCETLVFYRKRASEIDWVATVLWRAFDKTVRRKPLARRTRVYGDCMWWEEIRG
jgi:hypothetical protein